MSLSQDVPARSLNAPIARSCPLLSSQHPNRIKCARAVKSSRHGDGSATVAPATTAVAPVSHPVTMQYMWVDTHAQCSAASTDSHPPPVTHTTVPTATTEAPHATMATTQVTEASASQSTPHVVAPTPRTLLRPDDLRDADFNRESYLGEGSYSIVTLATHVPSGHVFALKEIMCARLRAMNMSDQLRWEINVHRRLRHPNIVRLYSYYYTPDDDSIRLVLEYCPRGTLHQYVHQSPRGHLDEAHASRYTRHIARAVAYIHSSKLVHRDLKLENVLLDRHGVAKLADFGWSRQLATTSPPRPRKRTLDDTLEARQDGDADRTPPRSRPHAEATVEGDSAGMCSTHATSASYHTPQATRGRPSEAEAEAGGATVGRPTVCGTLDYLSPEMVAHQTHTTKTDVWSLGVMLAEMLTGHTPFYRPSPTDTMDAIRTADPDLTVGGAEVVSRSPRRTLSASALSLVAAMLQKDPARRPTMEEVLRHPWLQKRLP